MEVHLVPESKPASFVTEQLQKLIPSPGTPMTHEHMSAFRSAIQSVVETGVDWDRTRILHFVAAGTHPEVVPLLLHHGASINHKDTGGNTPLHVAANACLMQNPGLGVAMVTMLLSLGADKTAKNGDGLTPKASVNAAAKDIFRFFDMVGNVDNRIADKRMATQLIVDNILAVL